MRNSYWWEVVRFKGEEPKTERFWTYQDALDALAKLAGLPSSAWGPNYYAVDTTPKKTTHRVCGTADLTYLVWHHA